MLRNTDLASLVRLLIGSGHEAVTVTQWVSISPSISDTQYLFVSPQAADLFGYRDVSELEGQYLSQRHTAQDFDQGAKLSLARRLGFDLAPSQYTSRIVTSSGAIRPVYKETHQVDLDGVTYWITKLFPTEKEEPLPDIDLDKLGISTDELSRFRRKFNVAMVENQIVKDDKILQSRTVPSILSQMTEIGKEVSMGEPESSSSTANNSIIMLEPGGSAHIPEGRQDKIIRPWIHWCQVCTEIWRSDDPEPAQCGRRRCRSFYWRTGVPEEIALESGKARRGRRRPK